MELKIFFCAVPKDIKLENRVSVDEDIISEDSKKMADVSE